MAESRMPNASSGLLDRGGDSGSRRTRGLNSWRTGIGTAVALIAGRRRAAMRALQVVGSAGIALHVARKLRRRSLVGRPRAHAPRDAGEAAQLEAGPLPLATWLTRAVQGAKVCVDGTLVGLWTEFGADG